jgi:hypothetical protein
MFPKQEYSLPYCAHIVLPISLHDFILLFPSVPHQQEKNEIMDETLGQLGPLVMLYY